MLYAEDVHTGEQIEATPGARGICPQCREPVIPKCGHIVTWHFAHRSGEDCDRWSEPESDWHRYWKELVPPDQREVVIGGHRADILRPRNAGGQMVIELQHSSISAETIAERERFYHRPDLGRWMTWLFDVRDCQNNIEVRHNTGRGRDDESLFIWKHAKRSLIGATVPVYLDIWGGSEPIILIWEWLPERTSVVEDSITGQELVERKWPRAFKGRRYPRRLFIERFFQPADVYEFEAAA